MSEHWEPKGTRFYDARLGEILLVMEPGHGLDGWLCYRGPEGQWVTLRKPTDADIAAMNRAVVEAHHAD